MPYSPQSSVLKSLAISSHSAAVLVERLAAVCKITYATIALQLHVQVNLKKWEKWELYLADFHKLERQGTMGRNEIKSIPQSRYILLVATRIQYCAHQAI
jgi:hypothetical protein